MVRWKRGYQRNKKKLGGDRAKGQRTSMTVLETVTVVLLAVSVAVSIMIPLTLYFIHKFDVDDVLIERIKELEEKLEKMRNEKEK